MTLAGLLALAGVLFLMALTPGPGVMALIARGMTHGLRPTLIFGLGLVLGDLCYFSFALLGLGVVAREFGWLFTCIRWAGAAYLVWLGLRCLLKDSARPCASDVVESKGRSLFSGLALTLGNPKVIAFYCGFLPAFMDLSALTVTDGVIAGCVVGGVVYTVLAGYAFLAVTGGRFFTSRRAYRNMNRGAGLVMIGAGAAVAAK